MHVLDFHHTSPHPSAAELRGICDEFAYLHHPVSFEYLAAWVYYHELAHTDLQAPSFRRPRSCTGLIVSASADNSRIGTDSMGGGAGAGVGGGGGVVITHVANMDQTPEAVRNITLRVHIVRGSITVAEGADWYWFTTGLSRMVRRGVASVQENWRDVGTSPHSFSQTTHERPCM
jgi:N-acylethanolamine-hydrolysing acid amidase